MNLLFKDETMTGKVLNSWSLPIIIQKASIREIIRLRIEREVDKYNQVATEYYNGLVQPDQAELTLNGFRMNKKRFINLDIQFERAIEGFLSNKFVVLVNDKQIDSLEDEIQIDENTEIAFIKLTPLVGG